MFLYGSKYWIIKTERTIILLRFRGVRLTYKTDSGFDDWIYLHLTCTPRDYRQNSAIVDLHTLQLTVTHVL
jgi:hypothetical protein